VLFRIVLGLHIAAGAVALAVFWIPLVAAKGGRAHRLAGKIYACAMATSVLGALGVVALRLFVEQNPRRLHFSVFLAFVAVLTFANGWYGVRVLRTKDRRAPHDDPVDLGVAALLFVTGAATCVWGVAIGFVLAGIFGALGAWLGFGQLRTWRSVPEQPRAWWFQHMGGMCAACIGTVTAFVVVNTRWLGIASLGILPWVTPGVIGILGIVLGKRYYRRKFARAAEGAR
jgi:uncharacterized membrane protein